MTLTWAILIYILNIACSLYLLAVYWDLSDPVTICVIVDSAHYIVVFILLIAIWLKWPNDNSNERLSWIEIFPTFGYVGCIFVIALEQQDVKTITAISNFSVGILRFLITVFAAGQKKRFVAIQERWIRTN